LQGCIELLERSGVPISGKSACVVGRSNIVGTPAAMLLQRRDATVTVVHSRTPNGQEICSKADIVIAACGKAEMITGDWIKEGAVVIDVGINAVDVSCRADTAAPGYIQSFTQAIIHPCFITLQRHNIVCSMVSELIAWIHFEAFTSAKDTNGACLWYNSD